MTDYEDYINDRLDSLFMGLRPQLPEDDDTEVSVGDALLSSVPSIWAEIQRKRDQQAEDDAQRALDAEVLEALEEASQATGLPFGSLMAQFREAALDGPSRALLDRMRAMHGDDELTAPAKAAERAAAENVAAWDAAAEASLRRVTAGEE